MSEEWDAKNIAGPKKEAEPKPKAVQFTVKGQLIAITRTGTCAKCEERIGRDRGGMWWHISFLKLNGTEHKSHAAHPSLRL